MIEDVSFKGDIKPRGHVKVELFDGLTGKKVDEREEDNFISRFVVDYYLRYKMMDTLTEDRYTSTDYPTGEVTRIFNDPFELITLTGATHGEEPLEEWLPRGNIVGEASTTSSYSGSDPLRGTINRAESFSQMGHLRLVFDWGTHAGNGTFQSIYFRPSSSYGLTTSADYFDVLDLDFDIFGCALRYGNKYYLLGVQNNFSERVIRRYDLNFNLENTYVIELNCEDFAIKGNQFLLLDYSQRAVYEVPISQPDSEPTKLFDTDSVYGIDYDPVNREYHLADADGFAIYDSNYQLKDKIQVDANMFRSALFFLGYGWLSYQHFFDESGVRTHPMGTAMRGIEDNYVFCESNNRLKRVPKYGIGSRALLDNPVTKTTNVTMKITYDFMYQ